MLSFRTTEFAINNRIYICIFDMDASIPELTKWENLYLNAFCFIIDHITIWKKNIASIQFKKQLTGVP